MTEPEVDSRRRFAMIPEDMLFDEEIPGGAVKVFGILHRYGSTPDRCYPSMTLIGKRAGLGKRQVRRYIEMLERKGWLERVARRSDAGDPDSNAYRLFPQRGGTDTQDLTPGQERPHPRSDVTAGYGHTGPQGAVMDDPLKRAREREPENEIPHAAVIDITTREERPPLPTFDDFWAVWPRKVGKVDARKAWDKAIKRGVDPHEIVAGAKLLAEDPNLPERRFIKHPSGWINGERWTDEDAFPAPDTSEQQQATAAEYTQSSYRGASRWA